MTCHQYRRHVWWLPVLIADDIKGVIYTCKKSYTHIYIYFCVLLLFSKLEKGHISHRWLCCIINLHIHSSCILIMCRKKMHPTNLENLLVLVPKKFVRVITNYLFGTIVHHHIHSSCIKNMYPSNLEKLVLNHCIVLLNCQLWLIQINMLL